MEIIRAGMQEAGRAAALAQLLWPGHAQAELEQELAGYLQGPEGAVFLAREDGADVGFAACGATMWRERTPARWGIWKACLCKRNTGAGALRRRCCAPARRGPGKKAVPNLQATVGWTTPQAPCFICAQALPRRGASSASQSGCEERGE